MKQYRYFINAMVTAMLVATLFSACSADDYADITEVPSADGTYKYTMHLNCQIEDSTSITTRATTSWDNGTTIYLRFKNGITYTSGTAVYNRSTDSWTVSTSGSLSISASSMTCEAYYFKNAGAVYSSSINLTENTACYHSTGNYSHPNAQDVYVSVTLKPKNWRLRFYGSQGTQITIQESGSDIYYYTSFNRSTGEFNLSKKDLSLSVGSNLYTPYIYGTFQSANSSNSISLLKGTNELYFRTINGLSLQNKGSGYLSIPTFSNYSSLGWKKLTASMSNTRFTHSGGNSTLSVTAPTNMSWSLSTPNSYVTLGRTSGTGNASVTVSLSQNSGNSYRNPTINFKAGSQYSQTITLTQGYRERIINYWSIKYPGSTLHYSLTNVQKGDQLDFDCDAEGQNHQFRIYLQGAQYVELVNRSSYNWGFDNYTSHKTYTFTTAGTYTLYVSYSTSYYSRYYNGGVIRNVDWIHN